MSSVASRRILVPLLLSAPLAAQQPASDATDARSIAIDGTNTVVRIVPDAGRTTAAVSRDGGTSWRPLVDVETQIHLQFQTFDPLRDGEPTIPAGLEAGDGNRLFVVQFETQVLPEYKTALRQLGAERRRVLPHQAFLVRMDGAVADQVRGLNFVRWVGDYHVAYKLDASIRHAFAEGMSQAPVFYNVVMYDDDRDRAQTLAAIADAGGKAMPDSGMGVLQVAELTPNQLLDVARDDTVLWIDPLGQPEVDIDQARIQGGADYVSGLPEQFEGKGLTGMVMEGIHRTHPEFAAIPPYRQAPISLPLGNGTAGASSGHGTSTGGEIYARGASAIHKGITPFAQMLYCNYNYLFNTNNRKAVTADGQANYGQVYETASWGYPRNTSYDSRSMEMDDIIFDLDMAITQSQSNSGGLPSRPQAWAKNIIACGAVQHRDTANPADDGQSGTSTGPAQDGRVKPDMCGYYDRIRTTSGSSSYTTGFGGTSGATPIVNGYAGLTIEMFARGMFGHPAASGWQQIAAHAPHFSTTKALLTNTAYQYPHGQISNNASQGRYRQGWGFPDAQEMYDNRNSMIVVDETQVLAQGQSRTYYVWRPAGGEFKATMVYAEPEGTSSASIHRINSVDLSVENPSGTTYRGNNGMITGLYSTPGGSANDRDTVEHVKLQNAPAGVYEVTVSAPVVRQDAHVETAGDDVDFALVINGIGGSRNTSNATMDLASTGAGNFTMSVSNLPASWASAFTLLSTSTDLPVGNGFFFGIEADSLTTAVLGAGTAPFFANNTAGQYPNTTFSFPAPIAGAVSGITFDATVLFLDGSANIIEVSNTDRVTVQ